MANTQNLRRAIGGDVTAVAIHQADNVDDFAALRTAFIALLAKLDADGGVSDTNYASTLTPAALKTKK